MSKRWPWWARVVGLFAAQLAYRALHPLLGSDSEPVRWVAIGAAAAVICTFYWCGAGLCVRWYAKVRAALTTRR